MSLALLFPGQGSQFVGMGRSLADAHAVARDTFAEADDVLGAALSRLMWEGPEEQLTETRNAQPAILVHSVAALRTVRAQVADAGLAAGHSLGEFTAHVAAGTLSFEDGLRAVRLRGELMHAAGLARAGAMAAVLGLDDAVVEELCHEGGARVCVAANFNAPGQVVISGDEAGVASGMERAREAGAKRVVPLSVAGAFHSPLMEPAAEGLDEHLASLDFADPQMPVASNVTAELVRSGADARALLVRQLTSPVRWSGCIATLLAEGADAFIELGPGSVLCGLNRRNARGMPCSSVGDAESVEVLAAS